METLRISPKYTADDWDKLNMKKKADWPEAVAIVRDRLHGRFIHFADKCLKDDYSGFVVLSIDCLLVETIQQFIEGRKHSKKKSAKVFKKFGSAQEFDGTRILGRFRQIAIFQPDCRHALAFSSKYRRFL